MAEQVRHQANLARRPAPPAGSWPSAAAAAICAAVRADPDYRPTPLLQAPVLARALGLGALLIKNEGARLAAEGLASFKPVGAMGAFAYLRLTGAALPEEVVCASDGNFGRAVAWAARRAGIAATVYLPQTVSPGRMAAIRAFGARTVAVDGGYDRAMATAAAAALRPGVLEMTDTGHPGARDIPAAIQDAYGVIADEILDDLADPGSRPTHLFVPAGVGGLAAGLTAALDGRMGPDAPAMVTVQPTLTPSLLDSLQARALRSAPEVTTQGAGTVMQCLACETPSTTAWSVLAARLAHAVAIDDTAAVTAMRALAGPGDDPPVVAGESGAAAHGALLAVCADPELRASLGLGPASRVVVVVTEGMTDPETYRRLVPAPD